MDEVWKIFFFFFELFVANCNTFHKTLQEGKADVDKSAFFRGDI